MSLPSEKLELTGAGSHCPSTLTGDPQRCTPRSSPAICTRSHIPHSQICPTALSLAQEKSPLLTRQHVTHWTSGEYMMLILTGKYLQPKNCSPSEKGKQRNQMRIQRSRAPGGTSQCLSPRMAGAYAHLQQMRPARAACLAEGDCSRAYTFCEVEFHCYSETLDKKDFEYLHYKNTCNNMFISENKKDLLVIIYFFCCKPSSSLFVIKFLTDTIKNLKISSLKCHQTFCWYFKHKASHGTVCSQDPGHVSY